MKADAASGNQAEISTMEGHQSQNRRKRKISEASYDAGMDLFSLAAAHWHNWKGEVVVRFYRDAFLW